MDGGAKDVQACVGCGEPVTLPDKGERRVCDVYVRACEVCLDAGCRLTFTRSFDTQAPFGFEGPIPAAEGSVSEKVTTVT